MVLLANLEGFFFSFITNKTNLTIETVLLL